MSSQRTSKASRICFIVVLTLIIAASFFIGAAALVMEGHAVPLRKLEQIQIGSNEAEVESILGSPKSELRHPYGKSWHYDGITWCQVTISFDSNGLVNEIVHDH